MWGAASGLFVRMDKAFMKTLFRDAGLAVCEYVWFLRE